MLNGFVNAGRTKQHSDELQALIDQARGEGARLTAMFDDLNRRGRKVTDITAAIERAHEQTNDVTARLDVIVRRIGEIYDRANGLELLEKQMRSIVENARQSADIVEKLAGPDGQLEKQRDLIARVQAETAAAAVKVEALATERSEGDSRLAVDDQTAVKVAVLADEVMALDKRIGDLSARLDESAQWRVYVNVLEQRLATVEALGGRLDRLCSLGAEIARRFEEELACHREVEAIN